MSKFISGLNLLEIIFISVLITLVVCLVLFSITEFLDPKVTEGRVVEKRHEPERRWLELRPQYVGKVMLLIPFFHYDDEDWILVIEGLDKRGKISQSKVYTSEETWESVQVGEWYKSEEEEMNDPDEIRESTDEEAKSLESK